MLRQTEGPVEALYLPAIVYGVFLQRHLVTRKLCPWKFMKHRCSLSLFGVALGRCFKGSNQPNSEGVLPLAVSPSGILAISLSMMVVVPSMGRNILTYSYSWFFHTYHRIYIYMYMDCKLSMFFQFHFC